MKLMHVVTGLIFAAIQLTAHRLRGLNMLPGSVNVLSIIKSHLGGTTEGCQNDKTSGQRTYYNHSNCGLPDLNVNALAVDKKGVLWVGTATAAGFR